MNIEYSTDGGTNWNIVVSATPNDGIHTWAVPNTITSQALIRINNVGNTSLFDVSNGVFTINLPTPILTSPNGGETWRSGQTHTVTWDANTVASNVKLEYSRDNGVNWGVITNSTTNTGSYTWTIPMFTTTEQALVRITNTSFPSAIDTSDAVFTIKAPITIDYPVNVNDTLTSCSTINIQISKSSNFENYTSGSTCYSTSTTYRTTFQTYYKVNGSNTWMSIGTQYGTCYTDYYYQSFAIPDIAPGEIKFLVIGSYSSTNGGGQYWQDSTEYIQVKNPSGTIVVTNPNGGVTMNALTPYNITWTANGTSGFFDVQYGIGGTSYSTISGASNISGNSYTWTVPNTTSSNVYIRVRDYLNNCRKDQSDAANTIIPAQPILTSPNGGEVWNVNSTRTITWNSATLYTNVNIEYSIDNGVTWNTVISSTPNDGSHSWTVPFNPSTQALLRISNVGNPSLFDVSNAVFTIQIPTPVLTAPNGGETWYAGTSNAITWQTTSIFSTTVNLAYSLDNGISWIAIANNISNTGTYSWTIPNVNSAQALVRVENTSNTAYYDVNDALFTLRPYVRITNPNGGNELGACTQTTISFEKAPTYTSFNIKYSVDNGVTWITIQNNVTYNNTFNTYNWTVPNTPSNIVLVRVEPSLSTTLGDDSDATFKIKKAVTIIQPNFGGVLQVGSVYPVVWQSDGISNIYDIAYSTAGPSGPWSNIALGYNTSTNTYNWSVPNTPSTNCYIRVRDNINNCKEDISDVAFTISTTANPITIVSPNGTDSLNACQSYNITWTEVGGPIGSYNIAYSIDNAINWIPVVTSYATTSYSYNWTVPNINSSNVLVRVQSAPNPTLFDISNALFNIIPGALETNNDTTICSGTSVQLNTTGGSSYSWLPTTGLSNPSIANPIATPTSTTQYIVSSISGGCSLNDTVLITVNPSSGATASVSIVPSPSTAVCSGSNVLFTASSINGGLSPSYQWKINGTNVGANTYTYSTNALANNDVVSCVMTSSQACVLGSPAASNLVTMTVFPNVTPSVSIATASTTICAGENITYAATAVNGGGNPTYQWKKNGLAISGANSSTYTTNSLINNDIISVDMVSNANCASPLNVSSNALLMTVNPNNTPTIAIIASLNSICTGQSVVFTANAQNAGASPTYQWKINGINAGTNSSTFTSTTLSNNDVITCSVSSSATCNTISTVTSNSVTMSVSSSIVPSVSILANATNVCAGTAISFTATAVNGGATPTYQWKVNGINAGTNSSIFSSSSLNNNDTITCIMTSSSSCAAPLTASSNKIGVTINPTTAPTVTVVSSAQTICAGSNVMFTANALNAGGSPSYQWKLNSINVGGNSATYNSASINNNDTVWCVVTSSSSCAVPNNSISNKLLTYVNAVVTPSVSISVNNNNVCANSSVIFTANVTNGGSTPIYQWKVNGINAGTNASSFGSTSLLNNDVVTCVLTSNVACATTILATSNAITMTVTAASAPSVSISTTSSSICSGTPVTFNASVVNGGGSPTYQWKKNGLDVIGAIANSYTTSALLNNDAISFVVTSSAICAAPATATSNTINMIVNNTVTPSVSIIASSQSICSGNTVSFTASPVNGGTSPMYQWKINGTNAGTNAPTFTTNTLNNGDIVSCVMTSNALCVSTSVVSSNALTIAVNSSTLPSVSITATASAICSGTLVTFSSTVTNGGGSPSFVWKKNGTIILGANTASYSSNTLADNDVITVELTSSAPCASPAIVGSNPIAIAVTPSVTPSISISASSTSVCAGSVTFTASAANGGSSPVYQWKINGVNAGTNANLFTSSTLNDGDVVSCTLTSNANCATSTIVNSNNVTMSVTTPAAPVVAISPSANNVCEGTAITFTTNVSNAGTSPTYQWKVNGNNVGINSSSFTSSTLVNGDVVSCQYSSVNACSGSNTVNSNSITMMVTSSVTASISINASSTSVCSGTSVSFITTATNGGSSPVYQWKVNGVNTGTNSSSFISNTLADNDIVTCVLTSNATCVSSSTSNSNAITMSVGTNTTPTVSITSSASSICTGSNVTFNATATNGGTSPIYQWKLNGANVGTNSSSYSSSALANGDVVSCVLTSNANCISSTTATSNALTMIVNAAVTPAVAMTASASSICSGGSVTFNATATNGGTTPSYQWKLNGNNVGGNSSSYSTAALNNGDVVTVIMTSSLACTSVPAATANPITITVNPSVTPTVNIIASQTTICAGSPIVFTATATNGGTNPIYKWYRNTTIVGTNSATLNISSLNNGDVVTCVLTSNAACASPLNVTSNAISVTVNNSIASSVSIVGSASSICSGSIINFTATPVNGGSSPIYQWKLNGVNAGTNSAMFSTNTLLNGDVVSCAMTSNAACASPIITTSNSLTIIVLPTTTPSVNITPSATTICTGQAVSFTAVPSNGGSSPSYQWKLNGANVGTNNAVYSPTILNNGDIVTVVMTSSALCNSIPTATATPITITVNNASTPDVSIVSNANNVCAGSAVQFTASSIFAGSSPAYQWQVNGVNVATGMSFTSNTLSNGDLVRCILSTSGACVSPNTVISNVITMNITPVVIPTINITASATAVCIGTTINFSTLVTNQGTAATYQWKVNGINVATGTSYSSSSLNNGDIVTCILTSNANCANPTNVSSNTITVSVATPTTPAVAVSATSTAICVGQSVTFTALPTNGGTSPTYQWKVNGVNVGTNNASYTSTSLNNGDNVTVVMTTSAACSSTPTATSAPTIVNVSAAATPDVAITVSSNSICLGSAVTFTATSTVAGANPVYQWQVNNVNVATGLTYTTNTLQNGNTVRCILTTSGACISPNTVTSNVITMTVTANVTPSISIVTSNANVCAGTSISFTASAINGGSSPVYQWKVNGIANGVTSSTFVSSSLNNNDIVTCELISSINCVTSSLVASNAIIVTINPIVTPSVAINASTTNICWGTPIQFTALPTNGGTTPSYQWKVNGANVGTNSNSFTSATLSNGAVVTVTMTATGACTNPTAVSATPITIIVSDTTAPTLAIQASPSNAICSGTPVTFTAIGTNAGLAPVYQWKVNGISVGSNAPTFTSTLLNNNDIVTCIMTSSLACVTNASANSNAISMQVTASPSQPIVTTNSPICENAKLVLSSAIISGATYLWNGPNGATYSGNEVTIDQANTAHAGVYTLTISINACSTISDPITVVVNPAPIAPSIMVNGNVLTSSNATNNQWLVDNAFITNATSSSVTANQTGYYQVRVTNTAGCYATSDSTYVVISAIDDMLGDLSGVSVYPNPVQTYTQISIDKAILSLSKWTYSISDMNGRMISFERNLNHENTLNWSEWADGTYFINVSDGINYKTFKLIKVSE